MRTKAQKRRSYLGVITREILKSEYIDHQKSICDIAISLGVSRMEVFRHMKRFAIPVRTKRESRALALGQGKARGNGKAFRKVTYRNHGYFKEWSDNMAYVLGVVFTDGCVSPSKHNTLGFKTTASTPRITIAQKTPELLEKILSLIGCDATIYRRPRRETKTGAAGEVFFLALNSQEMFDDLLSLGVVPKKSLVVKYPTAIPVSVEGAFIRGCWDGDGSITLHRRSITAKLVSGSMDFVLGMQKAIFNHTGKEGKIYTDRGKYYTLTYCSKNARAVLNFIYSGSGEGNRLTRKYETYASHLRILERNQLHNETYC